MNLYPASTCVKGIILIHHQLRLRRLHGEWFEDCDEVRQLTSIESYIAHLARQFSREQLEEMAA